MSLHLRGAATFIRIRLVAHFTDHSRFEIECRLRRLVMQRLLLLHVSDLRSDCLLPMMLGSHICVDDNHVFECTVGELGFLEFGLLGG